MIDGSGFRDNSLILRLGFIIIGIVTTILTLGVTSPLILLGYVEA